MVTVEWGMWRTIGVGIMTWEILYSPADESLGSNGDEKRISRWGNKRFFFVFQAEIRNRNKLRCNSLQGIKDYERFSFQRLSDGNPRWSSAHFWDRARVQAFHLADTDRRPWMVDAIGCKRKSIWPGRRRIPIPLCRTKAGHSPANPESSQSQQKMAFRSRWSIGIRLAGNDHDFSGCDRRLSTRWMAFNWSMGRIINV